MKLKLILLGLFAGALPLLADDYVLSKPVQHAGAPDGSAGVVVGKEHFIGASDEDNILRLYKSDSGAAGRPVLDLNPLLGFKDDKECDLEAAAQMGSLVFWIGSHGLKKNSEVRENRRVLFATKLSGSGGQAQLQLKGKPCTTLMDAFMQIPELRKAAAIAPEQTGGLNIEALCAQGGSLLIGFRNPISSQGALIVPLTNPKEAIAGKTPKLGTPFRLDLQGRGFRDMTPWRGQYLIVAGDAKDRSAPGAKKPKLFTWSGRPSDAPVALQGELGSLNPEAALAYGDRLQLLSDDGGSSFRSVWVNPTH